jgi:hypothetical protein
MRVILELTTFYFKDIALIGVSSKSWAMFVIFLFLVFKTNA